jgi:hypothetical protein
MAGRGAAPGCAAPGAAPGGAAPGAAPGGTTPAPITEAKPGGNRRTRRAAESAGAAEAAAVGSGDASFASSAPVLPAGRVITYASSVKSKSEIPTSGNQSGVLGSSGPARSAGIPS